jgi:hypothetical protein
MKSILVAFVFGFLCLLPVASAQQGTDNENLQTWPREEAFMAAFQEAVLDRIGVAPFPSRVQLERVIETSWVNRIGDVYVLYSPIFRTVSFIRYGTDLNLKDIRVISTDEAIKYLNFRDIVKPSPKRLMGRFEDGVALITLWQVLQRENQSIINQFLDNFHVYINIDNYVTKKEIWGSLHHSWMRVQGEASDKCLDIVVRNLTSDNVPDVYLPINSIPEDIRETIRVFDFLPDGDQGGTVILGDLKFARTFVIMPVNKSCGPAAIAIQTF